MTDTRRDILHGITLGLLLLGLLYPLIRTFTPYAYYAPDVGYVIAKVHAIDQGRLFIDPVSGTNTFHPIGYHLILYGLTKLGLSLKGLLLAASIAVYAGLLGFGYLVVRRVYSPSVALLAVLASPLVIQYFLDIRLLIPISWNVSVIFYLWGLWLALGPRTVSRAAAVGLIWAVTLMVSPVNIFLIGLYVLWDVISKRDRSSWVLLGVLTVAVLPLSLYQLMSIIREQGFYRQETFSLVPQINTLGTMLRDYLRGIYILLSGTPTLAHIGFLVAFFITVIIRRRIHWYVVLLFVVYFFTYLHFSNGYALRMQPYLNLFLAAGIIDAVLALPRGKWLASGLVVAALVVSSGYHSAMLDEAVADTRSAEQIALTAQTMLASLEQITRPDETILCDRKIYRIAVMPNVSLRALSCHGSMSYFQVKLELARQLEADYLTMTKSSFVDKLQEVVDRYNIWTAVIWRKGELVHSRTMHELLARGWREVYADEWFAIYRR